jgi:hypothetical protein
VNLWLFLAASGVFAGSSTSLPYDGSDLRSAEGAYASCIAKGIREIGDGQRDPRHLVTSAEARCDMELTDFVREFRADPWACTGIVEKGLRGGGSELSDRALAVCFVNYLRVLREHRILRLTAYRENHVKY